MRLRKVLLPLIFLPLELLCQTQSVARVNVTEGTVTAGQSIPVPVELTDPTPCPTSVWVNFRTADGRSVIQAYDNVGASKSSFTLTLRVPMDQPAGVYTALDGGMNPCPNYSQQKQFKVTPAVVNVTSVPDNIKYPTSAVVKLSLTENQFLDSKAAQLSELKNKLESELPKNRSDKDHLNIFLTGIASDALKDLQVAINQYDRDISKPNEPLPAFFADFIARYKGILSELGASSPAGIRNQTVSSFNHSVSLVYAQQLKSRSSEIAPNGEWPAIATELWQTIKEHIAAYIRVKSTGRITFDAVLLSFPPGARIRYKKVVDDGYFDYSSPTDVSRAEFELSRWDFIFIKDGCKDQPLRIDPYEEKEPVTISVELNCKRR